MTQEELDLYMEMATEHMDSSIDHLKRELIKIRTGKASPSMLSGLLVSYYGSMTPLNQVANVGDMAQVVSRWFEFRCNLVCPVQEKLYSAVLSQILELLTFVFTQGS